MDKRLKKRIINYQNSIARKGGHIPSVSEVRLLLEAKDLEAKS